MFKRLLALILAAHVAALSPTYGATVVINSYRFAAGGGGGAGVTFDSASTATGANSPSVPRTESITIGNLTNGYVIAWIAWEGFLVTGIDFDGAPMTLLKDQSDGGTAHIAIYGLAVGSKGAGTYNAVSAWSGGSPGYYTGGIVAFSGVHQTVPTGTAAGATGTSTGPTVNATSATDERVIGAVLSDDNGTITVGAGQTERNKFVGAIGIGGAFSDEAGTAATTHSYTKGSSSLWVIAAVPLKPAP